MPKETHEVELLLSCKATGREQMEMFTGGLQDAQGQANALLGTLGRFATVGGVALFARKSIQAFSDLEETTSKFRVVFAGLKNQADAAVQKLTESYGASILSARQMLSGTGDLLTGFGFDKQTALELSEQATRLGSDLASFSNYAGGAEGATMALTKAMFGETEQAKMLGIVIRQEDEEYKKLFKEIQAMTGATDTQTRALVTMRLAYKQSPNAIGDFERTMSSIANRSRMLQNETVQAYANIGEHLSGQFNALQGVGLDLLKTFNAMEPESQRFLVITGEVTAAMLAIKTASGLHALASGAMTKATQGNTLALGQEVAAVNAAAGAYAKYNAVKQAGIARDFALASGKSPIQAEAAALTAYNKELGILSVRSKAAADALRIRNNALSLGASRAEANALTREFIAQQRPIIQMQERLARMPGIIQRMHGGFVNANSAVKGIAASAYGLAKAFAPMFLLGTAVAGIDRLWRAEDIASAKTIREEEIKTNAVVFNAKTRMEAMEKEREMLREYYRLATSTGRDETQNARLSSVTDALSKKYKNLNLARVEGNGVLDISIEKYKEMIRLVEERQELEKQNLNAETEKSYADQINAIMGSIRDQNVHKAAIKDLWNNLFSTSPDMANVDLINFVNSIDWNDPSQIEEARNMAQAAGLSDYIDRLNTALDLAKKKKDVANADAKAQEDQVKLIQLQVDARKKYNDMVYQLRLDMVNSPEMKRNMMRDEYLRLLQEQEKYTDKYGDVKKDKDSIKEYYDIEKKLYELRKQSLQLKMDVNSKDYERNKAAITDIQSVYGMVGGKQGQQGIRDTQLDKLTNYGKEIARLTAVMNDTDKATVEERLMAQGRLLDLAKERGELEKQMALDAFDITRKRLEEEKQFAQEVAKLSWGYAGKVATQEAVRSDSIEAMRLQSRNFGSTAQYDARALQRATLNVQQSTNGIMKEMKDINDRMNAALESIQNAVSGITVGTVG